VVSIPSENVTVMLSVIDTELWLSAVVEIEETVGAVMSAATVKDVTESVPPLTSVLLVTYNVQSV